MPRVSIRPEFLRIVETEYSSKLLKTTYNTRVIRSGEGLLSSFHQSFRDHDEFVQPTEKFAAIKQEGRIQILRYICLAVVIPINVHSTFRQVLDANLGKWL